MKQFVFTLQALYDMQESIEKQVKMQMGNLEAEIAQRMKEMDDLRASFDREQTEYCSAVSGGVAVVNIKHYGYFFEKLRTVMLLQQGKITQLESEMEKCRQKLVHVRKEKMLLDKLRQEQYNEYLQELRKQQAKMMDDFVSYRTTVS